MSGSLAARRLWIWVALLVLIAIAAGLRIDTFASNSDLPQPSHNYAWDGAAIGFAKGHGLKILPVPPHVGAQNLEPSEYFTPSWESRVSGVALPEYNFGLGPAVLRGLLFKQFGLTDGPYRVTQLVLTLLLVPLIFYAANVISGSLAVGLLAAAFAAFSLFEPKASLSLGREIYVSLGLATVLAATAFAMRNADRNEARSLAVQVAAGMAIGLVGMFRNVSLMLLLALFINHALTQRWWVASRLSLAALVGWLVVFTPVAAWNQSRIGQFALSDETGASSLWMAVGLHSNPVGMAWTDFALYATTRAEFARQKQPAPQGFQPPAAPDSCRAGATAPECGPWDDHTLANGYYFGQSRIFEDAAVELWRQYLRVFPNDFLRDYLDRLWINATSFSRYASRGDQSWENVAPRLLLVSRAFGVADGTLQQAWLGLIAIIPILAILGALLAVATRPVLAVVVVPAALFLGQMSLATAGIARHNAPVLLCYYIAAAYGVVGLIRLLAKLRRRGPGDEVAAG